jgi:DNA ligase (NAD+)
LRHFASKDALNIIGLGEKQIEFLYSNKYIHTPVDIFSLKDKASSLEPCEGWGAKSVSNLLEAIERARAVQLERFIYALGIRHIGEVMARRIAEHVRMFDKFYECESDESLASVEGIGEVVLGSLQLFMADPYNKQILSELSKVLNISDYSHRVIDSLISGKKIVFTGTLINTTRSEAKSKAMALGARVLSAVSSQVDLVVAGSDAGKKLGMANELGIRIINEDEWLEMVSKQ